MNRNNQLICAHSMLALVILLGSPFVIAGWIPPPSPSLSRDETLAWFRVGDADNVRIAAALMFFSSALWIPPCVAIGYQMRRIEGPNSVLATVQMISAALAAVAIQIPAGLWLAITYRPDVDPSLVVTMNDLAWFMLLGASGPLVVQMACVGLCILGGDRDVYPRWLGYVTLWLATFEIGGVFIPFFTRGPLAWDGLIGFWIVSLDFFSWVLLMWFLTVRAIKNDTDGDAVVADIDVSSSSSSAPDPAAISPARTGRGRRPATR